MAEWSAGRVTVEDSVAAPEVAGAILRDAFVAWVPRLTAGLIRAAPTWLRLGSLDLLRFGEPRVSASAVEWPIEGGVLAAAPGGAWTVRSGGGRLVATVAGYRPRLGRRLYSVTQLAVHRLLVRLYLLQARGREPVPGMRAARDARRRAATVDIAFCATLARIAPRRRRFGAFVAIAAAYHVACWSSSGRTLGGLVTGERVVAVDGSRVTAGQALVRLLMTPASWWLRRPVHDEIAGTEVVEERTGQKEGGSVTLPPVTRERGAF